MELWATGIAHISIVANNSVAQKKSSLKHRSTERLPSVSDIGLGKLLLEIIKIVVNQCQHYPTSWSWTNDLSYYQVIMFMIWHLEELKKMRTLSPQKLLHFSPSLLYSRFGELQAENNSHCSPISVLHRGHCFFASNPGSKGISVDFVRLGRRQHWIIAWGKNMVTK